MNGKYIVVSTVSDDPFAIDVAHYFGQRAEISDLISLKDFANTELCPRFIVDEGEMDSIGNTLAGYTVVIVSTCCGSNTRNALAMRNCLAARAAKDNGAARVVLVEPDLFYSAQDRGPRPEHGKPNFRRSKRDFKKFDGQPFSSCLYAQILKTSGVDSVVTVHNHSVSAQRLFSEVFEGAFHNLTPAELYADYLISENIQESVGKTRGVAICAPDKGARGFVKTVFRTIDSCSRNLLLTPPVDMLWMDKERTGERMVDIRPASDSPLGAADIKGRDVMVFDDMVRTGHTIMECCRQLKEYGARSVVFVVTHFNSSAEVKENLNDPAIDEIVTTNTLPCVLNRDMQGRLRKKMLVLKVEKWMAHFLTGNFGLPHTSCCPPPHYSIDMSSKNPRAQN
jgi:ribose-phosphate pyrophosphokinase